MKSSRVMILASIMFIVALLGFRPPLRPALAHAELKLSDPKDGALLDRSPVAVFTWFSEPIQPGSQLKVFGSDFQMVTVGSTIMDANDASLMRIELTALPPGRYTVDWQAQSRDGYLASGAFDFSVRDQPLAWLPIATIGVAFLGSAVLIILGSAWIRRLRRRHAGKSIPRAKSYYS